MVVFMFLVKFVCGLKVIGGFYNLIQANKEKNRFANSELGDDVIVRLAYKNAKCKIITNSLVIIICLSIIIS